jgi:flagellar M-ring protein FliF
MSAWSTRMATSFPSSGIRCATPASMRRRYASCATSNQRYVKRIEAILAPIYGANNVRAQVAADVDFSQTDQVAETYRPNPPPGTAIRSQLTQETGKRLARRRSGNPGCAQQPAAGTGHGADSPPPVRLPASALGTSAQALQNFSKNSTINYEVDKTVRHTKGVPGSIRRLSVAVVVNFRAEAPKDRRCGGQPSRNRSPLARLT